MSAKLFLRLTAGTTLLISLVLVTMPGFVENYFVSSPSHGGDIFIRFLGSALIGYTYLNWHTSKLDSVEAMQATFLGNLSTLTIAFFISLSAVITGTLNPKGLFIVLLHFTFAVGFGFYTFKVRHHLR